MLKVRLGPRYARIVWEDSPQPFDLSQVFDQYRVLLKNKGITRWGQVYISAGGHYGTMKIFSEHIDEVLAFFAGTHHVPKSAWPYCTT